MTDTFDVGPDPQDFLRRGRQRVMGEAMTSLEDDPQKVGRAYELGRATGDSPALIYSNMDNYEEQHKAALTSQLLNSNDHLREYIDADPMHAKLSNDDYANLDTISGKIASFRKLTHEGIGGLPGRTVEGILGSAWKGFHEGIGEGPLGSWVIDQPNVDRLAKSLYATAALPLEIPLRLLAGGIHGATEGAQAGAKEVYKTFTGDEQGAERFARDIAGMVEMQITGVGVHKPGIDPAAIKKAHDALISTKLWNESGREPPAGLDPTIDKLKLEQNNADISNLDDMIRDAQQSATRERDPDTYAKFLRMRDEGTIAIDPEAIGKLYGDKVPHGEDGLLGWEPSLEAQLTTAKATGADVEIPIADFLAKVDPEVYKALKDDIRVRPGGITKNEAKVASEQKEILNESLVGAAIKVGDEIFDAPIHALALEKALSKYPDFKPQASDHGGFITSTGRYVRRNEATEIAKKANQIKPDAEMLHGGNVIDAASVDYNKIATQKEREVLPEDLPQLRAHAGLEPLFSIGDRKLALEKQAREPKPYDDADFKPHDFKLLDETGQAVGHLNLTEAKGGKEIHVDMISGVNGLGPTSFGPALMRDLLRQIKAEFPNAERLGGYRVSGAREKTGAFEDAWIKLDAPDIGKLRQLFANSEYKPLSPDIEAVYKPTKLLSEREHELSRAIGDELDRLIPKQAEVSIPSSLRRTKDKREVYGAHVSYSDRTPFVIVSLDSPHPIGTARHEAIHHLRQQGFFTEGEWDTLARTARDNGWIEKFGIERKYKDLPVTAKLEEAVAEGFRDWKEGKPTPQAAVTLFERLQELLGRIKDRVKEIFGKEVSWEELFQKVDEGKVGQREGNAPRREGAYKESVGEESELPKNPEADWRTEELVPLPFELPDYIDPKVRMGKDSGRLIIEGENGERSRYSVGGTFKSSGMSDVKTNAPEVAVSYARDLQRPETQAVEPEAKPLFRTPATIGMTAKQANLYTQRLREMHDSDIEWAKGRAEADQRKRLTAEWKQDYKNTRSEVEADMNARPDVAADLFFGRGELYGEKLPQKVKIGWGDLTHEERAGLPKDYVTKAGVEGAPLDDIASLTGFPSGKAMIEHLVAYNQAKLSANMSAKAFRDRMVDLETDRQMAGKHGDLEQNILDQAKEQVTSETQLNLIGEEVLALGIRAGGEATINKAELKTWISDRFADSPMSAQSSDKYLKAAGKGGTAAEIALLKEDFAEAYRAKQQQYVAMMMAQEARKLEREQKQFGSLAKRLSKRDVKGLEQTFQDEIQTLLWQGGLTPRRSMLEIQRSQAITGETLQSLVQTSKADGWSPDVGTDILAGRTKSMDQMTVQEFREFRNAITSLNKIGRAVEKINIQGEVRDFNEFKESIITNIMTRPKIDRRTQENKLWKLYWGIESTLVKPETLMKALDLGEEMGPLVNAIARPFAHSKAEKYTMQEQLAEKIKDINNSLPKEWKKSLKDDIPNDWFRDPSDDSLFKMSREDLIGIMLNRGNKGNVTKFNHSWGTPDPARQATKAEAAVFDTKLKQWIDTHATREDWKFVQGIFDIYAGYRDGMETVWSNTAGTQPRLIEPVPIDTPHGTFDGGYFPLIRDQFLSPRQIDTRKGLFEGDYPNYSTPQGHLVERTGAPYFVDFRQPLSMIPTRMQQVIHDIAYRSEVMSAAKILRDKDIQKAIRNHYGDMYVKQLDAVLEKTARGATINEKDQSAVDSLLRKIRLNLIQYALPFNYVVTGTPDVGNLNLAAMTRYWGDKKGNNEIAAQWSKEIPHAIYNMDRDFAEAMQKAIGEGKMDEFKTRTTRWGYKIVQAVSQEFRTSVFIDKFREGTEKGLPEAEAAAIADAEVRQQFGSTAIHDLPSIMTTGEKGRMITMFFGFFNGQYNRLRPMRDMMKREEYMDMAATAFGTVVVGSAFGALIANSAKEDESWLKRVVKSPFLYGASLFPFVREAGTMVFEGIPPRTALGSVIQSVVAVGHDAYNYLQGKPVEKGVQHAFAALGLLAGFPGGLQFGRTGQGLYDYSVGKQRPRTFMEWQRLLLTGEMRLKHSGAR